MQSHDSGRVATSCDRLKDTAMTGVIATGLGYVGRGVGAEIRAEFAAQRLGEIARPAGDLVGRAVGNAFGLLPAPQRFLAHPEGLLR